MLDYFTPEDNERDDNDYHKQVRVQAQQPTATADDREFTIEEIRYAVESMDKKAPGEDGITSDIYNHTFKNFTKIHNRHVQWMLKIRSIPKEVEESEVNPYNKTWKRRQLRSIEIPPNQPSQCRRQSTGESHDKQNQSSRLNQRLYKQKPIWIYSATKHNRRSHGSKRFCRGRV